MELGSQKKGIFGLVLKGTRVAHRIYTVEIWKQPILIAKYTHRDRDWPDCQGTVIRKSLFLSASDS